MGKSYRKYKHNDLIKLLVVLGGVVGLALSILSMVGYSYEPVSIGAIDAIIRGIVGCIISVLTILMGTRPNDPIPWHWIVMIIFSILLLVFASLWAFILVLIAGLIGLVDDL